MGMLGPYNLTVGQPYKLNIPQDSKAIEVQNDSQYDVFISFKLTAPAVVTVSGGEWDAVVRRGHTSVIPVYGQARAASAFEATRNALAQFQGTMWLLSTNPGGLAQTGTVSGRNNVYVTPIAPYDSAPMHAALSTQHDLTSQPRVITVPVWSQTFTGNYSFPDSSTWLVLGPISSPAIAGTQPTGWNGGSITAYLHWLYFTLGTTDTWGYFEVHWWEGTNPPGTTPIKSYLWFNAEMEHNRTNGTGFPCSFTPHIPNALTANVQSSTQALYVGIKSPTASAYPVTLNYNLSVTADDQTGGNVGPIGEPGLYYFGPNGAPIF